MRPFLLLFCGLLLPFLGESQPRPTLDVLSGYEYSYRSLDGRNKEEGIFTFRYGLNYNQPLTGRWILKFGLRYVQNGNKNKIKFGDMRWGTQTGGAPFTPVDNPDLVFTFKTQHRFLSMPIALRYQWGNTDQNLHFYLEAGTATSIY